MSNRNTKSVIMRGLAVTFFVLVGLGSIALWSISIVAYGRSQVIQVQIQVIRPSTPEVLMTVERVDSLLRTSQGSLVGKSMNEIDIGKLTQTVKADPAVAQCEIVLGVDGVVRVKVNERQPIFRVLNPSGNGYYVDEGGTCFSLLNYAVAEVPVFLTETEVSSMNFPANLLYFSEEELAQTSLDEMVIFGKHLSQNKELNDLVEHVQVKSYGGFEVIPRIGNQILDFGMAFNLDLKTKMLFQFYKSQANRLDLEKYDRINLNYEKQIVCVKRGELPVTDTTNATQVVQPISPQTTQQPIQQPQ
jgi:cell division protein FtsQ